MNHRHFIVSCLVPVIGLLITSLAHSQSSTGVPKKPEECTPNPDLAGLVSDANWGQCGDSPVDCPCTYRRCDIGRNYKYAKVLVASKAHNEHWSVTKVRNGVGKTENMYCTIRSCQISSTNTNTSDSWLRCWGPAY